MPYSFLMSSKLATIPATGVFDQRSTAGAYLTYSKLDKSFNGDRTRVYGINSATTGNAVCYLLNSVTDGDPYGEWTPTSAGASTGVWAPKEEGVYLFSSTGSADFSTGTGTCSLQISRNDANAIDYLTDSGQTAGEKGNLAGNRVVTAIPGLFYALWTILAGTATITANSSYNRLYINRIY